jgi:uncharacterized protein (TIGR03083 family)
VNRDDYLDAFRANAAALVDATRQADLDATVPSCPDWKVRDLAGHMGTHYRWVRANTKRAPEDGPQSRRELDAPPADNELADWIARGAAELASTFEQTDLDAPCWTFIGEPRVRFWCRRSTQETAMHRWDAQNANGSAQPIEAALASDGIDEWLMLLGAIRGTELARSNEQTIHVHCTDEPGEWLLRLDADGMQVTPEHAKGDVAARGTASDLLLLLLGRKPASDIEVFGDASLLDAFLEHSTF